MRGDGGVAADAISRLAWGEARDELTAVARDQLAGSDLERLGTACYLTGRDEEAVSAFDAAYRRHVADGRSDDASRCAFWAAFTLMMRGQMAQAGAWLGRAETEAVQAEGPAAGYLMVPAILGALDGGDAASACALAEQLAEVAARFHDPDLEALATLGHGQALLALGQESPGVAKLDAAMLAVTSGEVGPIVSGIVYCAVIIECMQLFDLGRATEWTGALDRWCAKQPDLVAYRGQCLVHRSQIEQAGGRWTTARSTVDDACRSLADPPHPAYGLACYQRGELCRLAGELDMAADAFRDASRHGYEPMPGLAMLDLARGDVAAAAAGIDRVLTETAQPFQRPGLLAAAVEIHLAGGDLPAARLASEELTAIAALSRSEMLTAMAQNALGATLVAEGSCAEALPHLRAADRVWQQLGTPYEMACSRSWIGRACATLGDHTSAEVALDQARDTFLELGARTDLQRLGLPAPASAAPPSHHGGDLSPRELEVLALVAAGRTNPEIASALHISRHTVGRHLENIFAKLGVANRAAATAFAYEHDLI